MSSKRQVRRKSCQGKKRYRSSEEALAGLIVARKHSPEDFVGRFNVYRCKFCHAFHIGHSKLQSLR